jgi:hypothetical protein
VQRLEHFDLDEASRRAGRKVSGVDIEVIAIGVDRRGQVPLGELQLEGREPLNRPAGRNEVK